MQSPISSACSGRLVKLTTAIVRHLVGREYYLNKLLPIMLITGSLEHVYIAVLVTFSMEK